MEVAVLIISIRFKPNFRRHTVLPKADLNRLNECPYTTARNIRLPGTGSVSPLRVFAQGFARRKSGRRPASVCAEFHSFVLSYQLIRAFEV